MLKLNKSRGPSATQEPKVQERGKTSMEKCLHLTKTCPILGIGISKTTKAKKTPSPETCSTSGIAFLKL
jgi:hypothetical protein